MNSAEKRLVAMLFSILFCSVITSAQLTFQLQPSGATIHINGLNPTICAPSSAKIGVSPIFPPVDPIQWLSTNESTYHTAEAGFTDTIILDIPDIEPLAALNTQKSYRYGPADGMLTQGGPVQPEPDSLSPAGMIRFKMPVKFARGTKKGLIYFTIVDTGILIPTSNLVVIPIAVAGVIVDTVPRLGTIVQPQIPYLILHAPPGDASSSEVVMTKKTCREYADTYAEDGSLSTNAAVKVGIAGSVDIFVSIPFEFTVTLSAEGTQGDVRFQTTSKQTCVTVSEGYATGPMSNGLGDGDADVYIGYGVDVAYGIAPSYRIDSDTCRTILDTAMVYGYPDNDDPKRAFAYTKSTILNKIVELKTIVADSIDSMGSMEKIKAANNAQNQIDVWDQVLALNLANIQNQNNEILDQFGFDGGAPQPPKSHTISVLETSSIEVEHYIENTAGIQTVIEVAGNGIRSGLEYKSSKRFGKTRNQFAEDTRKVSYILHDGDPKTSDPEPVDIFEVQVVRDPMFGTPIFRLQNNLQNNGTRSSCPYQGGYQREQPALEISEGSSGNFGNHAMATDISGAALFRINVKNESNETRSYRLKLDANTNFDGAIVTVGGTTILGTNNWIDYAVPPAPNGTIGPILVAVERGADPDVSLYDSLRLVLYSECEPEIEATVTLSAQFVNISSTKELKEDIIGDRVFPNPTSDAVTVELNLLQSTQVHIGLYDLLGNLQMRDIEDYLSSGTQQMQLDVSRMLPGVYMLQIQSESTRITRKLVINW